MSRLNGFAVALFSQIVAVPGVASAQDYPNKPVRIVTAEPGGTNDFAARLFARELTANIGQQVIVENRATGVIAADVVAKALPDGYTLLLQGNILWLGGLLQPVPYDAVKDFAPVALTNTAANVLVVHPALAAGSVKDLIALAKAKPGELNYGCGATGASNHLAAELFRAMAGVNLVRITYKSSGPILNALLGAEIQMTFGTAASVLPQVKSGKLRGLAVTSLQPSELAPGLPPISATLPGYESVGMYGIVAPNKTPEAIVNRLYREIDRVAQKPDVKEKFLSVGVDTVSRAPAEFSATIKSDMARMGRIIRETGIQGN